MHNQFLFFFFFFLLSLCKLFGNQTLSLILFLFTKKIINKQNLEIYFLFFPHLLFFKENAIIAKEKKNNNFYETSLSLEKKE